MKKLLIILLAFFMICITSLGFYIFVSRDQSDDVSSVQEQTSSETTNESTLESTEVAEETIEEITEGKTEEDIILVASGDNSSNDNLAIENLPEYDGNPYVELNDNVPFFTEEEKQNVTAQETYSKLDSLGRCGVAFANLCRELMPTEERGEIGEIKPSGWHTVKYNDLIEGNYLYNRCHLIAYRLAGENANEQNLLTGTRYLNAIGMLTFENMVGDYLDSNDNHVLYRVTPIFEGDNLVASGVEMEAWSVEDEGKGICFNVYCYNVQPGIDIDYATGESCLSPDINEEVEKTDSEKTADDTVDTESYKPAEDTESVREVEEDSTSTASEEYIVNTNTKRIHIPTCSSVDDMAEHNKMHYVGTLDELISEGYVPCKRCLKGAQ